MVSQTILPAILLLAALSYTHADDYGVDASFPIHYSFIGDEPSVSNTLRHFGPAKIELYREFIDGCEKKYSHKPGACKTQDEGRMALNRDQPREMTNYTDVGFEKTRLSPDLWTSLKKIWEDIKAHVGVENIEEEYWPETNTYVNHWVAESKMMHLAHHHQEPIWQEIEGLVRKWIPEVESFSRSSLYGIRVYTSGSILATHVDRDPLITSAIINVGQDVDEDWPLEVYDHDGKAHNITMVPGDVLLYESHSVLHGRPFPLRGKYYANIFVHFKPLFGDEGNVSGDESEDEEDESEHEGDYSEDEYESEDEGGESRDEL